MSGAKEESRAGRSEPTQPESWMSIGDYEIIRRGDHSKSKEEYNLREAEHLDNDEEHLKIGEELYTPDELRGCLIVSPIEDDDDVAIGVTLGGLWDKEDRRYVGLLVNADLFFREKDWRELGISDSMAASIESTMFVPLKQISEFRKGELVLRCPMQRLVTLPSFLKMNEISGHELSQLSRSLKTSQEDIVKTVESQAEARRRLVQINKELQNAKDLLNRYTFDEITGQEANAELRAMGMMGQHQRYDEKKNKLQALREEIRLHLLEKAGGYPKYAYSNELLDEIVRIKPRSKSDLKKIRGMGPRRMESSEEILQIIDRWMISECVSVIRENLNLFTSEKGEELFLSYPEKLDEIGSYFAQWLDGRRKVSKRTSSVEATEEIFKIIFDRGSQRLDEEIQGIRVNDLRSSLDEIGMEFSPSRLSQLLQPMVKDGLLKRSRFGRGIVMLGLTEKWEILRRNEDLTMMEITPRLFWSCREPLCGMSHCSECGFCGARLEDGHVCTPPA